jgi:hypothetical protein
MPCNPPYSVGSPAYGGFYAYENDYYAPGLGDVYVDLFYTPTGPGPYNNRIFQYVSPAGVKLLNGCYCMDSSNCDIRNGFMTDDVLQYTDAISQTVCCSPCSDLLFFDYKVTGSSINGFYAASPQNYEWQCVDKIIIGRPTFDYDGGVPKFPRPYLYEAGVNPYPWNLSSHWSLWPVESNRGFYNRADYYSDVDVSFEDIQRQDNSTYIANNNSYFWDFFIEYDATDLCCASKHRYGGYSVTAQTYLGDSFLSYIATNSGNLTVKMASTKNQLDLTRSSINPVENVGYILLDRTAPSNQQPCNTIYTYANTENFYNGGLYNPNIIKVGCNIISEANSQPRTTGIISTSPLVMASIVRVFSPDTCVVKYFYGFNSIPLSQGETFCLGFGLMPIDFPELNIAGIIYPAKTLPFEVICSNSSDCEIYASYASNYNTACCFPAGQGCIGNYNDGAYYWYGRYNGSVLKKHCNNLEPINYPSYSLRKKINKKTLEKQVLSRIKKVHYKP